MKYFILPRCPDEKGYFLPVNLAHVTAIEKSDPTGKYIITFKGTDVQWFFTNQESRDKNYDYLSGL